MMSQSRMCSSRDADAACDKTYFGGGRRGVLVVDGVEAAVEVHVDVAAPAAPEDLSPKDR